MAIASARTTIELLAETQSKQKIVTSKGAPLCVTFYFQRGVFSYKISSPIYPEVGQSSLYQHYYFILMQG